ncbi:mitochondrial import receptor subunit TOM20 homolog [Styela clava]
MVSKTAAVAAAAGVAFIGYCVYFDRKRRSDPDFRKKLKERRRKAREGQCGANKTKLPDLRDVAEVQKFFLEEVQKGEELLGEGKYEEGVEHLTNAVAVCGQPQQLLQVLQQTLPPQVFNMLLEKLPSVSQRLATSSAASAKPAAKPAKEPLSSAQIADVDDLE